MTTTSSLLREEIEDILHEYYKDERQPTHKITENILKLFEKRIDDMIPETIDRKHSFELGYSAALNDVKELLK